MSARRQWVRGFEVAIAIIACNAAHPAAAAEGVAVFRTTEHAGKGMFPLLVRGNDVPSAGTYFRVSYTKELTPGGVRVRPSIPYAELIVAQLPVIGVHMTYHGFQEDVAPDLDVVLNNSTARSFLATSANFAVRHATVVDTALPVFETDWVKEIALYNYSHGTMQNVSLRFALVPIESAANGFSEGPVVALAERPMTAEASDEGAWSMRVTDSDVPPALRDANDAAAVGYLLYDDATGNRRQIPFCTTVILGFPSVGAPMPPTATYDLALHADSAPYLVKLPIRHVLAPQTADCFKVRVISDKWARYSIDVSVTSPRRSELALGHVDIEVFAPRTSRYKWQLAKKHTRIIPQKLAGQN